MRRVSCKASLMRVMILAATLGLAPNLGIASYFEPTTGYVQDWSVEQGHLVLDGVRYRVSRDVRFVDHDGNPLPLSELRVGARISVYESEGIVVDIVLARDE